MALKLKQELLYNNRIKNNPLITFKSILTIQMAYREYKAFKGL